MVALAANHAGGLQVQGRRNSDRRSQKVWQMEQTGPMGQQVHLSLTLKQNQIVERHE